MTASSWHLIVAVLAVLALAVTGCRGGGDVAAPSGGTVTHDPNAGPPGCSEWAAQPPTPRERADGCLGDNADLYMDAVAAVPLCEAWTRRPVSEGDVAAGCRSGPVDLAVTADLHCADGRTLFWNERVWGYVGEPARTYPPGAAHVAPDAEQEICTSW